MYNMADLITIMRYRLNDSDSGQYSDAELGYCLNTGIKETELALSSNVTLQSVTTAADTITNTFTDIFDIWNDDGVPLQRISSGNISAVLFPGVIDNPTHYWINGSVIHLYPTPDTLRTFSICGITVSTDLGLTADVTSLPDGQVMLLVLDRAESEARRMRLNTSTNQQLHGELFAKWNSWIKKLSEKL